MEGLFNNGDAEKAKNELKPVNVRYIPHQGVYHSRKPNKIRVLFVCEG